MSALLNFGRDCKVHPHHGRQCHQLRIRYVTNQLSINQCVRAWAFGFSSLTMIKHFWGAVLQQCRQRDVLKCEPSKKFWPMRSPSLSHCVCALTACIHEEWVCKSGWPRTHPCLSLLLKQSPSHHISPVILNPDFLFLCTGKKTRSIHLKTKALLYPQERQTHDVRVLWPMLVGDDGNVFAVRLCAPLWWDLLTFNLWSISWLEKQIEMVFFPLMRCTVPH